MLEYRLECAILNQQQWNDDFDWNQRQCANADTLCADTHRWTLDAAARGVAIMGGAVFVSTALLGKANEAAGCIDIEDDRCEGRVYGMRPSSLLTNIVAIVGLISACFVPLVGSIIDHTNHRRQVGRASALLFTLLIFVQVLLLEKYWFASAIVQIFIAILYSVHLCSVYAYLPELTSDPEQLTKYASRFTAAQYSASVIFLVLMVYILSLIQVKDNVAADVDSAKVSQYVVVVICTLFFGYAWSKLFGDRKAKQIPPPGQTVYSAGFHHIFETAGDIWKHHSAIKWFLIATAFTESATNAFSSIAITFITTQLHFSSTENGIAILLLLVFAVPGTRIAASMSNRFNPIRSLQCCLIVFIVNTGAAALVLQREGQQTLAYAHAIVWGLCLGWVYPTEKALFCTIITKGSEAELMGVYICSCQVLTWLPPLTFTVMNEVNISMRLGLLSLNAYFLLSFLTLFMIGDYEDAVKHARDIDEGKISFPPEESIHTEPVSHYSMMDAQCSELMPVD